MARRTRKTNDGTEATDRELSYEEYTGAGARPRGTGGRRNVAPGAQEFEPEDYDEQNRRNVGGEGGAGIETGTYEEDYGPGARGFRRPDFLAEPKPGDKGKVLRRKSQSGDASDDFPTGTWSAQKTNAQLRQVKSRKIRARGATGRGVGVPKPKQRKRAGSTIRHPATRGRRPQATSRAAGKSSRP